MEKDFYPKYYEFERSHWWFRARAEILRSYIIANISNDKPALKILNVGSATGASSMWLSEIGEVTSVEYDQDCIEFLQTKQNVLPVIQGSILELPFKDNSFDLVCALDVVEHVEDDQKAAMELVRVCNPKGSVLVTVPAFMSLWSQHDVINHHYRRYDQKQLTGLFSPPSVGKIEFCTFFNYRLFPFIFIARKISNFLNRVGLKEKSKSDLEYLKLGLFDSILYRAMRQEKSDLPRKTMHAKGVSLILHWKKFHQVGQSIHGIR